MFSYQIIHSSNRAIDAPVVGDIESCMDGMLEYIQKTPFKASEQWVSSINNAKSPNDAKMEAKLNNVTSPMNFFCA